MSSALRIAALAALLAGCADTTPPLPVPVTCEDLAPCAIVTFAWDSRPDTMHVMVTHAPTIAPGHAIGTFLGFLAVRLV